MPARLETSLVAKGARAAIAEHAAAKAERICQGDMTPDAERRRVLFEELRNAQMGAMTARSALTRLEAEQRRIGQQHAALLDGMPILVRNAVVAEADPVCAEFCRAALRAMQLEAAARGLISALVEVGAAGEAARLREKLSIGFEGGKVTERLNATHQRWATLARRLRTDAAADEWLTEVEVA